MPYAQINSRDSHWLRIGTTAGSFAGPIPQNASGNGFQLEALLTYQVWDCFNIGVGGRYWRLRYARQRRPRADGRRRPSPTSQPMDFTSERYGAFVQGSYKFGAM